MLDPYFLGLFAIAIIVPIVYYLIRMLKKRNDIEFVFTEEKKENVTIGYERHGWPTDSHSIMVKTNGEVLVSGKKTRKLDKNRLRKLQKRVEQTGFFNVPERTIENFTDGSMEVWYANIDGRKHKVHLRIVDEQKRPEALKKIREILESCS